METKTAARTLLSALREEKAAGVSGGIYHKLQVDFTYNSNHIEGSRLSEEQTRYIFETNSLLSSGDGRKEVIPVDDVVETANHFRCIDLVIDNAERPLDEEFIKQLHLTLKNGTVDSRQEWFAVGDYKRIPNEVGGCATTAPEDVPGAMRRLLATYNGLGRRGAGFEKGDGRRGAGFEKHNGRECVGFEEIVDFHYQFEAIHPFQDGNGRVGRLVALKECLRSDVVPFGIDEELKPFYYRGLKEYAAEPGFLLDTCRTAQDKMRVVLEYFRIKMH